MFRSFLIKSNLYLPKIFNRDLKNICGAFAVPVKTPQKIACYRYL